MDGPIRPFSALNSSIIGLMRLLQTGSSCPGALAAPPNDRRLSESTKMGPSGEAILPQSAAPEGAAFVCSVTLIDCWIIAPKSANNGLQLP